MSASAEFWLILLLLFFFRYFPQILILSWVHTLFQDLELVSTAGMKS